MREISLNLGLVAMVDDDDYQRFGGDLWFANPMSHSSEPKYYVFRRSNRKTVYLHRLIMDASRGEEVDHVDGNPLNNQRSNLRFCSRSLNCANSLREVGSSGYRGVYQKKKRFFAAVFVKRKIHIVGRFSSAVQAAHARDAAARDLYGDFAVLNFPTVGGGRVR